MTMWRDGKKISGKGMRGTLRFEHTHGDKVMITCTFRGVFQAEVDEALPSQTFSQIRPVPWINTAARIQDDTLGMDETNQDFILNTITLDQGNEVVVRENTNTPGGYQTARIVDRDPSISFNPDEVLDATFPFVDNFRNGKIMQIEWLVGSVAGNQWLFRGPGLVCNALSDGERDTVDIYDITAQLSGGEYPDGNVGVENEYVINYA
jgi:hypothetical protein